MAAKPRYVIASGCSDMGVKRKNNEDAFGVTVVGRPWDCSVTSRNESLAEPGVMLAVSDGVGGSNAGEVASWLAVETLHGLLNDKPEKNDGVDHLRAAVVATDAAIRSSAQAPGRSGMGATLSALWLRGENAYIGHVGDSRIYRWRAGTMTQLTRDHSPVGRMRQEGSITEEAARHHKFRSMIEQSLGGDPAVFAPDAFSTDVKVGDVYLLCSDGLTDGLWDAELAAFLGRGGAGEPPQEVCRAMVAAAKRASGKDNITAIVAHVGDQPAPAADLPFWRRLFG